MDTLVLEAFHNHVKTALLGRAATAVGSRLLGGATNVLSKGPAGGMRQKMLGGIMGASQRMGPGVLARRVGYGAMGAGALGAGALGVSALRGGGQR